MTTNELAVASPAWQTYALRNPIIALDTLHADYCRAVGIARNNAAFRFKHRAALIGPDNAEANHVLGAMGECAFAIHLGETYKATINTFKVGGDVGPYQVRTRRSATASLIVRDGDRDTDIFVLVVQERELRFRVVGWILGGDAKRADWKSDPGNRLPAYFVPQERLHTMGEFDYAPSNPQRKEEM